MGGTMWGVQGVIRRFLKFQNLDFRNRAQVSGRVGHGDDFPPPHLGVTPPGTRGRGPTRSKIPKFLG